VLARQQPADEAAEAAGAEDDDVHASHSRGRDRKAPLSGRQPWSAAPSASVLLEVADALPRGATGRTHRGDVVDPTDLTALVTPPHGGLLAGLALRLYAGRDTRLGRHVEPAVVEVPDPAEFVAVPVVDGLTGDDLGPFVLEGHVV